MNLLAEGHTATSPPAPTTAPRSLKAPGEIFKKPDGRPDRRAIRAYCAASTRRSGALAGQLTRQGNQASMTYGQMLHLLAYLDQWAATQTTSSATTGAEQAALIRSFTYEDPKTGEVRALTSEDTWLLSGCAAPTTRASAM